jgi:hypothetical protein
MLTAKANQQVGTFYQQIGNAETRVINTTLTNTSNTLTFQSQGVWAYLMSPKLTKSLKQTIAGKTKQEAIRVLLSLPGIETASISGVNDNQRVPKNPSVIRVVVFEGAGSILAQSI